MKNAKEYPSIDALIADAKKEVETEKEAERKKKKEEGTARLSGRTFPKKVERMEEDGVEGR